MKFFNENTNSNISPFAYEFWEGEKTMKNVRCQMQSGENKNKKRQKLNGLCNNRCYNLLCTVYIM